MKPKILTIICICLLVFSLVSQVVANDNAGGPERVPVLIGFTHTPGPSEQALVRSHGGAIKHSYHLVPAIAATVPEPAIQALAKNPNVTRIEPDGTFYLVDELDSSWGVKMIGAGFVHAAGNKGEGVKVGILDTGVDYTHPDLDANFDVTNRGYDFVNEDLDPMDDLGHGTHVAGIIAAEDDGTGVVGVAPRARLYALKIGDKNGIGNMSDIVAALDWAVDEGIQVTNNSYGWLDLGETYQTVKDAFDASAAVGIIHVCAAGNGGNRKGTGDNVLYPAKFESCIAVAATDSANKRALFSATGPKVEISAPGVLVYSTLLGGGYGLKSGTSMASPHVAGTVALMISKGVGNVKDVLTATADDLGDSGWDPQYGAGLVDADEAAGIESTEVHVASISYSTGRGKNRKDLLITVALLDNLAQPVAQAWVDIGIDLDESPCGTGSGTTGLDGKVTFTLTNAPSGTYTTIVTDVTAGALSWDGMTPPNSFTK